jgi:integrase/recombinase XerD
MLITPQSGMIGGPQGGHLLTHKLSDAVKLTSKRASKSRYSPAVSASGLELIFSFKSSLIRQRQAPFLESRELFLSQMLAQGTSVRRLRSIGTMLLHIIRVMELKEARPVGLPEVKEGAIKWALDIGFRTKNGHAKTEKHFTHLAIKWLRFSNMYVIPLTRVEPDDSYTEQFVHFIQTVRGMGVLTVRAHRLRVRAFLKWNTESRRSLADLTLSDVDAYILFQLEKGHKPTYVRSICHSLVLFFQFGETRKWTQPRISQGISRPRIPRVDAAPKGPEWADVRRLLDHDFGSNPAALRASAITALGAIYGLRSSEVVNLKLGDFDWRNEIITIRRSKNGRVQQFPIQLEVGNKVIRYLREARPKCKHRNLFVSLNPPYRAVDSTTLWVIVANRLKVLGICSRNYGVHALRHACATHLLHEGTSLKDIADFLGHSNLRSVSIYAKHDMEALKRIAAIDLKGIL